jgi:hypothetical protein
LAATSSFFSAGVHRPRRVRSLRAQHSMR